MVCSTSQSRHHRPRRCRPRSPFRHQRQIQATSWSYLAAADSFSSLTFHRPSHFRCPCSCASSFSSALAAGAPADLRRPPSCDERRRRCRQRQPKSAPCRYCWFHRRQHSQHQLCPGDRIANRPVRPTMPPCSDLHQLSIDDMNPWRLHTAWNRSSPHPGICWSSHPHGSQLMLCSVDIQASAAAESVPDHFGPAAASRCPAY